MEQQDPTQDPSAAPAPPAAPALRPRISITYCTGCNWLLRAGWMAQELLQTFGEDLAEVALIPGYGGVYEIRAGEALIWERKRDGGFPEVKEIKKRIRDLIDPERDLGHIDRSQSSPETSVAPETAVAKDVP